MFRLADSILHFQFFSRSFFFQCGFLCFVPCVIAFVSTFRVFTQFYYNRFFLVVLYFFYLWLVSRRYQWMTWWIYIQAMVYRFYIHFYCWNYNTFELEWLRTFLFSSKIISVCKERSQFHWNLNTILCSRLNWRKKNALMLTNPVFTFKSCSFHPDLTSFLLCLFASLCTKEIH